MNMVYNKYKVITNYSLCTKACSLLYGLKRVPMYILIQCSNGAILKAILSYRVTSELRSKEGQIQRVYISFVKVQMIIYAMLLMYR